MSIPPIRTDCHNTPLTPKTPRCLSDCHGQEGIEAALQASSTLPVAIGVARRDAKGLRESAPPWRRIVSSRLVAPIGPPSGEPATRTPRRSVGAGTLVGRRWLRPIKGDCQAGARSWTNRPCRAVAGAGPRWSLDSLPDRAILGTRDVGHRSKSTSTLFSRQKVRQPAASISPGSHSPAPPSLFHPRTILSFNGRLRLPGFAELLRPLKGLISPR